MDSIPGAIPPSEDIANSTTPPITMTTLKGRGPERVREIANGYLGRVSPGTEAGEAERFYGYYTLHTEKDGEITGMLSVNGYSGEVWYHSWHEPFVAMEEQD